MTELEEHSADEQSVNPALCSESQQPDVVLLGTVLAALAAGYIVLPAVCSCFWNIKSPQYNVAAAAGPLLSLAFTAVFMRRFCGSFKAVLEVLHLNKFPVRMLLWALPMAMLLMLGGGLITAMWQLLVKKIGWQLDMPLSMEVALTGNLWQLSMIVITALVAAPLFEEILFRRALFSVLKQHSGLTSAVWISAAAFALLHLSVLQLPGLCFMAVIWQIFYLRSKSLWSSIILHFCNNFLAVVLLLAARSLGFVA